MTKQNWKERVEGMRKDSGHPHFDVGYNQAILEMIPLIEELLDERVDECINAVKSYRPKDEWDLAHYPVNVLQALKQNKYENFERAT